VSSRRVVSSGKRRAFFQGAITRRDRNATKPAWFRAKNSARHGFERRTATAFGEFGLNDRAAGNAIGVGKLASISIRQPCLLWHWQRTEAIFGKRRRERSLPKKHDRKVRAMWFIGQFFAADSAATAIEYGLIAPGAAAAILVVVVRLRTALNIALSSVGASSK